MLCMSACVLQCVHTCTHTAAALMDELDPCCCCCCGCRACARYAAQAPAAACQWHNCQPWRRVLLPGCIRANPEHHRQPRAPGQAECSRPDCVWPPGAGTGRLHAACCAAARQVRLLLHGLGQSSVQRLTQVLCANATCNVCACSWTFHGVQEVRVRLSRRCDVCWCSCCPVGPCSKALTCCCSLSRALQGRQTAVTATSLAAAVTLAAPLATSARPVKLSQAVNLARQVHGQCL